MEVLSLLLEDDVGILSLITIVGTTLVVLGALYAIFKNIKKKEAERGG